MDTTSPLKSYSSVMESCTGLQFGMCLLNIVPGTIVLSDHLHILGFSLLGYNLAAVEAGCRSNEASQRWILLRKAQKCPSSLCSN
uniref:Uncharacterized protein n=1 Tax=Neogobius melanostomus TaxID=47308 RepID=A0A8C6WJR4_9GOBI